MSEPVFPLIVFCVVMFLVCWGLLEVCGTVDISTGNNLIHKNILYEFNGKYRFYLRWAWGRRNILYTTSLDSLYHFNLVCTKDNQSTLSVYRRFDPKYPKV